MRKVYFLARFINPNVGGGLLRLKQIELLRENGFEVVVVLPNYESGVMIEKDNQVQIPLRGSVKANLLKQYLGLVEDYLDPWEREAFTYLSAKVNAGDIIFASASGELSCLKLASRLKDARGSYYAANLHDPLDYSRVNGEKFGSRRVHVSREKSEHAYLSNADLIITSSLTYRDVLSSKYPELGPRIVNSYFGYADKLDLKPRLSSAKLRIGYGGSFQSTQSPELLAKAGCDLDDIEIYFIGKHEQYRPLRNFKDKATFVASMEHQKYLEFMMQNIDVGFVSLASSYLGVCVPSKIFEYINLGIPIIGALPDGDGRDLINNFHYGLASHFDDLHQIRENILYLSDKSHYESFSASILGERNSWEMKNLFASVIDALRDMN